MYFITAAATLVFALGCAANWTIGKEGRNKHRVGVTITLISLGFNTTLYNPHGGVSYAYVRGTKRNRPGRHPPFVISVVLRKVVTKRLLVVVQVRRHHRCAADADVPLGTRPEPFNSNPMGVNSTSCGSPHVRCTPMWALSTRGA